ncbi:MAG TPA: LruC domain-containing protein, partial [Bacteroidales bacterium]|nr:LruC domain-containing protein [Bacteroidales bacterium]
MKAIKSTIQYSIVMFLAVFLFSSCERNEQINPNQEPESIFDLDIPEGFLFETTQNTNLNLKALDQNGETFDNLRWQVFTKSPEEGGRLITEGISDNSGDFSAFLSMPIAKDSLYVGTNFGGIAGEMMAVENGSLNYSYQQQKLVPVNKTKGLKNTSFITKMTFDDDLQGFMAYRDNNELSAQHSSHPETPLESGPFGSTDGFMWGYDTQGGLRSFEAPAEFHGNIYGNYIAYDYYVGNTAEPQSMQANTGDIRITDGNKVLSVDFMASMPHQVNGGWQTLYIKLDETATQGSGWRIGGMNTFTTGSGNQTLGNNAATAQEIQTILQNVTRVLIAPEGQNGSYYGNGYGPEFIGVDNVGIYESLDEVTILEQGDDPSDSDGDGVSDELDAYPDDAERAFDNYSPGEDSYATLAFEDLWPEKGDYDFNDLVVDYRFNQVTNAENKVVDLKATFVVQAIGAGFQNGFALQLPVSPSAIQSVEGQVLESGYLTMSENGTESGPTKAVIPVFENSYDIINSGGSFVNTIAGQAYIEPEEITITVNFTNPQSPEALGTAPYNPFIIAN